MDIAIVQSPSKSTEFNMEHFAEDDLTFFSHPMHPFARKKSLDLQDLAGAALITREGKSTTHKMLQQLKSCGVKVNVALRCVSPDAVKAAVRSKMGVGILFYSVIADDIKRKDLKTLKFSGLPVLTGNSYIVYSKSKPLSCAASDFLILLRSMKTRLKNPANGSETNEDPSFL